MSKQLSIRKSLVIAMVLAMGMAGCLLAGCSSGSNNADASLTAQAEPGNGAILAGSNYGNAGVQVTAGSVIFFAFALYWDFQTIRRDKETRDNLRAKVQGNAAN